MNKIALVILITLVIITSILFYQFYPPRSNLKQNKNACSIYSEETTLSEDTPLSEEESHNIQHPLPSIQSNLVSKSILNTYNTWKADLIPPTPQKKSNSSKLLNKHTEHIKLTPINPEKIINTPNQLRLQFMPYLNYETSTDKNLTNSNTCFSNEKDSCPLGSYKQCSNNYPLQDYNSFEVCNCNVNKICPYKSETAQNKPAIKLECPIVSNQENKTLILP